MNVKPKFNFFRKNYEFILCIILLILILIVAINPKPYINATFQGFSIWAKIVLPSLFCFFIFTKLLMQNDSTSKIFSFLNKPFEKIFNTPNVGGYTFIMSAISGYPVGAKLISEFYQNGNLTTNEAFRLSCYACTTGPMFVIGSVAVSLFYNANLGIIVLLSHFLSSLINGLIFRKFCIVKNDAIDKSGNKNKKISSKQLTKQSLNDIMYNTITSILMVGGFIALCFTVLEVLNYLNVLNSFAYLINKVLPKNAQVGECLLKGIVELTNGCVSLSAGKYSLKTICIVLSFLCSFGGLSIHLQCQFFLSKCNIKYKYFLLSKVSHSIISIVISAIFSAIML